MPAVALVLHEKSDLIIKNLITRFNFWVASIPKASTNFWRAYEIYIYVLLFKQKVG